MVNIGPPAIIGLVAAITALSFLLGFWCYLRRRRELFINTQRGNSNPKKPKVGSETSPALRLKAKMHSSPAFSQVTVVGGHFMANRNSLRGTPDKPHHWQTEVMPKIRPSYSANGSSGLRGTTAPLRPYTPAPLTVELYTGIHGGVSPSPDTGIYTHTEIATQMLAAQNESSVYRASSVSSDDTMSVYSAASAPLGVHERLLVASQPLDTITSAAPISPFAGPLLYRPLDRMKDADDQIAISRATARSSCVWPRHLDLHAQAQQVICRKEGLVSGTYPRVRYKSLPSGGAQLPSTIHFNSGIELDANLVVNKDGRKLKPPSTLALRRQKSTSLLSLIPQGPLSGTNLNGLLAAPRASDSAPLPSHRHTRPHPIVTPAVPITLPQASPFAPPIVNESVQFLPVHPLHSE